MLCGLSFPCDVEGKALCSEGKDMGEKGNDKGLKEWLREMKEGTVW